MGSGMRNMMKYGKHYGGSDPQLVEGDVFRMIISVPEFGKQASHVQKSQTDDKSSHGWPESGQSQARVKPESIRSHLLMVLSSAPLSKSELAAAIGHKSISGTLNAHIREMLAGKLIEYVIPDKPNSRLQKYRLTEKGKALAKEHSAEIKGC